jgi:crotonobetainyl-CoA:carnitine CoA-transferase CaiB-like acyl-CoA transferase
VNELDEVFADPQVREREMVVHVPHPKRAAMPMLANPIRPVRHAGAVPHAAAGPGRAHGRRASDLLGYDERKRRALREQGVI